MGKIADVCQILLTLLVLIIAISVRRDGSEH